LEDLRNHINNKEEQRSRLKPCYRTFQNAIFTLSETFSEKLAKNLATKESS